MDNRQCAAMFKAFCDENRLQILLMLKDGEKCACRILEEMQITQPTLSHHMKILCDSGVVVGRKEGKWMHYSISNEGIEVIRASLDYYTKFMPVSTDKDCCKKPKVAFLCVHNSCRSQMAEALGKKLASDVFESYSAGTELKDHINPDAVRMMKKLHGIDMELTQRSKLIEDIPQPDVVILMGCNVSCPYVQSIYTENWGLEDPSGQSDEFFEETICKIEENVLRLKEMLQ